MTYGSPRVSGHSALIGLFGVDGLVSMYVFGAVQWSPSAQNIQSVSQHRAPEDSLYTILHFLFLRRDCNSILATVSLHD
jgi:hypothetical protein